MSTRAIRLDDPHLDGVNSDARRWGPAIELSSGAKLRLEDPDPALLTPEVLAAALSKLCRWTGHVRAYFSVAQHCVIVSRIVPEELALEGLLHDASEAVVGDLNRPLKLLLPGFARIENRIHRAIALRYGTNFPHDRRVKEADNVSLATELRDLFPAEDDYRRRALPDPLPEPLRPLGPVKAERLWLARFEELR